MRTLALQKVASEQLGKNNLVEKQLAKNNHDKKHLAENNLYKKQLDQNNFLQTEEEACKEQLLTTGFPAVNLNQHPFSNNLVQQSGAKAASHPELLQKELLPEELADKNFDKNTLAATSLHNRNFRKTASEGPA